MASRVWHFKLSLYFIFATHLQFVFDYVALVGMIPKVTVLKSVEVLNKISEKKLRGYILSKGPKCFQVEHIRSHGGARQGQGAPELPLFLLLFKYHIIILRGGGGAKGSQNLHKCNWNTP